MELGISTFAELTPDPSTGRPPTAHQRLKEVVEEAVLAEQVGLDVYAVGEHHRPDFAASAPEVVLAAIAARTERIRLSSAVTVLSSDDPVRVFQRFSTLDLLSDGRAEVMAGRGSFTESFPLFGYDLEDYDELFAEKLDLLLALRDHEVLSWEGGHRPAFTAQGVYPRPLQEPLPVWVAVGGTPQSVARAGVLGLPLALAIIGGEPRRFTPLVDLHREALAHGEHGPQPIGVHLHGYVAQTSQQAADEFYGPYAHVMTQLGRERGWRPMTKPAFEQLRAPEGSLAVGSPEQVAEKLLLHHELFGHQRVLLHVSVGTLPHAQVLKAIELLGTEVAPIVRAEVARREAAPVPS